MIDVELHGLFQMKLYLKSKVLQFNFINLLIYVSYLIYLILENDLEDATLIIKNYLDMISAKYKFVVPLECNIEVLK